MDKNSPFPSRDQFSLARSFADHLLYSKQFPQSSEISYKFLDSQGDQKEVASLDDVPDGVGYRPKIVMGLDTVRLCNDQLTPDSRTYIQRAAFYSDKIVVYPECLEGRYIPTTENRSAQNLTRGRYNGYISKATSSRIRRSLEGWIKSVITTTTTGASKRQNFHSHIGFLTLTLPTDQVHDDNTIKRSILTPYIQQLKRVFGVQEYFWKAEPQVNGNIHFHLLIDRWVDREKVNDLWNVATNNLGYLDRYVQQTQEVRPPSTNIRSCPKDMSLVKYVMKYVTKSPIKIPSFKLEGGKRVKTSRLWLRKSEDQINFIWVEWREMQGRVWGMSDGIRKIDVFRPPLSYRIADLVSILQFEPAATFKQLDHCEVYYCNVHDMLMRYDPVILSDYRRFYLAQYQKLYHADAVAIEVVRKLIEPRRRIETDQIYEEPVFEQLKLAVA